MPSDANQSTIYSTHSVVDAYVNRAMQAKLLFVVCTLLLRC